MSNQREGQRPDLVDREGAPKLLAGPRPPAVRVNLRQRGIYRRLGLALSRYDERAETDVIGCS